MLRVVPAIPAPSDTAKITRWFIMFNGGGGTPYVSNGYETEDAMYDAADAFAENVIGTYSVTFAEGEFL
jgi:hypothetical protein